MIIFLEGLTYPKYLHIRMSFEEQAKDLVSRMTLEKKV
jgi:hypothetical protein